MKNNEITWQDEKDIVELITELAELLKNGYSTVMVQSEEVGDGDGGADGNDEFRWTECSLIAK